MNKNPKSKKEVDQIIDQLIEFVKEVDKKYPKIQVTEEFYKKEKEFIKDIIYSSELKTKQISEFLYLLLEYPRSCEYLKVDFQYREGKFKFVFLLDLSEIYSVMHRDRADTFWGATANSFLNEFKMHSFSILPATVWEFLLYLKNLSKELEQYLSTGRYEELLSSRRVKGLLDIHKSKGPFVAYENYLESGGMSENIQLLSDRRFDQIIKGPISTFLKLVRNKRITPLNELGVSLPPTSKFKEKRYDEIYQKILMKLDELRIEPEKKISNIIDAINFTEAFILNDTHTAIGSYFMFVSRGKPLRTFRLFPWTDDPLRNQVKMENTTIARSTQYVFYHVKIDNLFVSLEERLEFIDKCLHLFSSSFLSTLKNIMNLTVTKKPSTANDLREDAFKFSQFFQQIASKPENHGTLDTQSMEELLGVLDDRGVFSEKVEDICKTIKTIAGNLRDSLSSFSPERKIELLEPDLVELEEWLK